MFAVGELFPSQSHYRRINRYKENRLLFEGKHAEVFRSNFQGTDRAKELLYISVNLAGIICKKSADFLFGEEIKIQAGIGEDTAEQRAFDRFFEQNHLNILLYESALSNSYAGDTFMKIRYGQEYGGELPAELDPYRVIIENLNPEQVFPETVIWNKDKIKAYNLAIPYYVEEKKQWFLSVEKHTAGKIHYTQYTLTPHNYNVYGEVDRWTISGYVEGSSYEVNTGVNMPLIVHIPNLSTVDRWEGLDDLSEIHPLLDEINNRISQIADILDKHSNPAMAVPSGLLSSDQDGNAQFRVAVDKVFEVMGKEDIIPSYITWNGQLDQAFQELDRLIDLVLTTAEIPAVALGRGDSGTSGSSGLAIKWRMNSLLAKINRKRQYYQKGIKQMYYIAQMLEGAVGVAEYTPVIPVITFNDGLPKDEMEQANIMSTRTGGAKTLSQKSAIMMLNNFTEEQAEVEMERIKKEAEAEMNVADPSIFNEYETEEDPAVEL